MLAINNFTLAKNMSIEDSFILVLESIQRKSEKKQEKLSFLIKLDFESPVAPLKQSLYLLRTIHIWSWFVQRTCQSGPWVKIMRTWEFQRVLIVFVWRKCQICFLWSETFRKISIGCVPCVGMLGDWWEKQNIQSFWNILIFKPVLLWIKLWFSTTKVFPRK